MRTFIIVVELASPHSEINPEYKRINTVMESLGASKDIKNIDGDWFVMPIGIYTVTSAVDNARLYYEIIKSEFDKHKLNNLNVMVCVTDNIAGKLDPLEPQRQYTGTEKSKAFT